MEHQQPHLDFARLNSQVFQTEKVRTFLSFDMAHSQWMSFVNRCTFLQNKRSELNLKDQEIIFNTHYEWWQFELQDQVLSKALKSTFVNYENAGSIAIDRILR